jgi:hypothetical protein
MVSQVALVIQDLRDRQGLMDNREIKDNRVPPALEVSRDRMELRVLKDNLVHKDLAEVLALLVDKEPQDRLVIMVLLAQRAIKALQDLPDHRGLLEMLEPAVKVVNKVLPVSQELKDRPVLPEQKELQEQLVQLDNQEQTALREEPV